MARTLLIGSQTGIWREWQKANLAGRNLLCLDPASADFGLPGRAAVYQGEKCLGWHFVGSLSAHRSPHVIVATLAALLSIAGPEAVIELFPYRPGPLRLQMLRQCAALVQAEETLVERRLGLAEEPWPGPAFEMELGAGPPASVLAGQRKARWLQMMDQCELHEIDLRSVAIDGARLGSGRILPIETLKKMGFQGPLHAEAAGSTLLIVSDAPVDDLEVSRALDVSHASKAIVVPGKAYDNLLCAFAGLGGEDFGMGRIESIDVAQGLARIQCTAVSPAPVRTLRIGGLRVDAEGREVGELKPWEA